MTSVSGLCLTEFHCATGFGFEAETTGFSSLAGVVLCYLLAVGCSNSASEVT